MEGVRNARQSRARIALLFDISTEQGGTFLSDFFLGDFMTAFFGLLVRFLVLLEANFFFFFADFFTAFFLADFFFRPEKILSQLSEKSFVEPTRTMLIGLFSPSRIR